MRLPETDNENIHVFVSSTDAHRVNIKEMEEESRTEIKALLSEWLATDAESDDKYAVSSSGSGCDSGFSLLSCSLVMIGVLFRRKKTSES